MSYVHVCGVNLGVYILWYLKSCKQQLLITQNSNSASVHCMTWCIAWCSQYHSPYNCKWKNCMFWHRGRCMGSWSNFTLEQACVCACIQPFLCFIYHPEDDMTMYSIEMKVSTKCTIMRIAVLLIMDLEFSWSFDLLIVVLWQ